MIKLTILLCIVANLVCFGQTPSQNLSKYWDYRDRLTSKFIINRSSLVLDYYTGTNIPASYRNPTTNGNWKDRDGNSLSYGDATSEMGYYLALLATEYKLLQQNGQSTVSTVSDIVKTLWSLERLDIMAESYYGAACGPQVATINNSEFIIYPYDYSSCLNGFFIRDDVDSAFAKRWRYYYDNKTYSYPFINFAATSDYIYSDFENFNEGNLGNEMSQDQVWNLLVGFTLVKKLVDHTGLYLDGEGETVTITRWIKKITYRMIKYMQIESCIEELDICEQRWKILNPVTGNIVSRGGNPEAQSQLFVAAGNEITDLEFGDLAWDALLSLTPGVPFHAPTSESYDCNKDWHGNFYFDYSYVALATISKHSAYAETFNQLLKNTMLIGQWYNGSMEYDLKNFCFEHLPLIYLVLHEPSENVNKKMLFYFLSYIKSQLDLAPDSERGPFKGIYDENNDGVYSIDDYPAKEWSSSNRLSRPLGDAFCQEIGWGEFNGIDFMLLHNLYWLVYDNLGDIDISGSFPHSYNIEGFSFEVGKQQNFTDYEISTLGKINLSGAIDGKVAFSANEITINGEFEVNEGACFELRLNEHIDVEY